MRHRTKSSSSSKSSSPFGGWKLIGAIVFAVFSTIASAYYVTAKETDEKETKENERQAAIVKHREGNKESFNGENDETNSEKTSWDNSVFEEKEFEISLPPAPAPSPASFEFSAPATSVAPATSTAPAQENTSISFAKVLAAASYAPAPAPASFAPAPITSISRDMNL